LEEAAGNDDDDVPRYVLRLLGETAGDDDDDDDDDVPRYVLRLLGEAADDDDVPGDVLRIGRSGRR
jgi:hypothetical protein